MILLLNFQKETPIAGWIFDDWTKSCGGVHISEIATAEE